MKAAVASLVQQFEAGKVSADAAVAQLKKVTGRDVDKGWLENYWRSESLEEFVERVCEQPISNWATLTDAESLQLIQELIAGTSAGRRDSITAALDRRYRKASGTTLGLWVDRTEPQDPQAVLDALKKDTVIYL